MEHQDRRILKDNNSQQNMIRTNKSLTTLKSEVSTVDSSKAEDDYDSSSSEDYRSAEEDDAIFNNELDSIISGFKNVHILTPKGKKLKHQLQKSFSLTKMIDPNLSQQLAKECLIANHIWSDKNNQKKEVDDCDESYLSVTNESANVSRNNVNEICNDHTNKENEDPVHLDTTRNIANVDLNRSNSQTVNNLEDSLDKKNVNTILADKLNCTRVEICSVDDKLENLPGRSEEYMKIIKENIAHTESIINNESNDHNKNATDNIQNDMIMNFPVVLESSNLNSTSIDVIDPAINNLNLNSTRTNNEPSHNIEVVAEENVQSNIEEQLNSIENTIEKCENTISNELLQSSPTKHEIIDNEKINIENQEQNKSVLNIETKDCLNFNPVDNETLVNINSDINVKEEIKIDGNLNTEESFNENSDKITNIVNLDSNVESLNRTNPISVDLKKTGEDLQSDLPVIDTSTEGINKEQLINNSNVHINNFPDIEAPDITESDLNLVNLNSSWKKEAEAKLNNENGDLISESNGGISEVEYKANLNETILLESQQVFQENKITNLNETVTINDSSPSKSNSSDEFNLNCTQVLQDCRDMDKNVTISITEADNDENDQEQKLVRCILDTTPDNYGLEMNLSKNTLKLFEDIGTSKMDCDDSLLAQLNNIQKRPATNIQKEQEQNISNNVLLKFDESTVDESNRESDLSMMIGSPYSFCKSDLLESTTISSNLQEPITVEVKETSKGSGTGIFKWLGNLLSPKKLTEEDVQSSVLENESISPLNKNISQQKSFMGDSKLGNEFVLLSDETPLAEFMSVSTTSEPFNESQGGNDEMNELLAELEQLRSLAKQNENKIENMKKEVADQKIVASKLEENIAKLENEEKVKINNEKIIDLNVASFKRRVAEMKTENEQFVIDNNLKIEKLKEERDSSQNHLSNVENSFSSLHKKYEQSKKTIGVMKTNQAVLQNVNTQLRDILTEQQSCFVALQNHATKQLENSQADYATQEHQQKVEMIRWTAQIKKAELQKTSLEEAVEKKKQENTELLSLCDSLIQKVK